MGELAAKGTVREGLMWRAALTAGIAVSLAGAVMTHVVFAENPAGGKPASAQGDRPTPMQAQDAHVQHMEAMHGTGDGVPTMPGQDAFGAIAEIVRILDADPATDWSKVDIERLRQHLIDMNEVALKSAVKSTRVPGGLAMEVTGPRRTEQAIRAMVVPHAIELDRMPQWSARTETIPGGVRLTVLARKPDDTKLVARIRGLGFAGLITEGAHHQAHHLAMARGEALAGHAH